MLITRLPELGLLSWSHLPRKAPRYSDGETPIFLLNTVAKWAEFLNPQRPLTSVTVYLLNRSIPGFFDFDVRVRPWPG